MGVDARVYVKTQKKFTDEEILRLAYEVGLAFGADRFYRFEADSFGSGHHNISRIVSPDDMPDITPPLEPGDTILEVHVWTRYYGPGYERGDLPFLITLGEWLERKIPGCLVLYGGDDGRADPFDVPARAKLLDHFAGPKSRAYFTRDNPFMDPDPAKPICPTCRVPMAKYAWGGGIGNPAGAFYCGGCDARMKTKDGVNFEPCERGKEWP